MDGTTKNAHQKPNNLLLRGNVCMVYCIANLCWSKSIKLVRIQEIILVSVLAAQIVCQSSLWCVWVCVCVRCCWIVQSIYRQVKFYIVKTNELPAWKNGTYFVFISMMVIWLKDLQSVYIQTYSTLIAHTYTQRRKRKWERDRK